MVTLLHRQPLVLRHCKSPRYYCSAAAAAAAASALYVFCARVLRAALNSLLCGGRWWSTRTFPAMRSAYKNLLL